MAPGSHSIHKFAKATRAIRQRHQTCLSVIKSGLFDLDIYAFTPQLVTAQFSTWVSLMTTLFVSSLFMFAMGYTLFLWASTAFSISSGEVSHENTTALVAPTSGPTSALPLPQAGAMLLLGNGTSPTNPDTVVIEWEQNIICSGQAKSKVSDMLPSRNCEFRGIEDGLLRTDTTRCAHWETAKTTLPLLNNTASNPCGLDDPDWQVPRVAGTFYDREYAYITATVRVSQAALSDPRFVRQLYKGSAQLFMIFPYTGTTSLSKGNWPDGQKVLWSRRVNLQANTTMKWEVSLRVRQVSASSFFWDIPQLELAALDYAVQFSEVSVATSTPDPDGYQEVAKMYIKLDDRDMQVTMTPYATVFSLFSDWGGFLSILVAIGIPAMLYNQSVFRSTVSDLMAQGAITFDEDLRKKRSQAIATSFAVGVNHKEAAVRRQSMMRIANMIDAQHETYNSSYSLGYDPLMDGSVTAGRPKDGPSIGAHPSVGERKVSSEGFINPRGSGGITGGLSSKLKHNRVAPVVKAQSSQPAGSNGADSRHSGSSRSSHVMADGTDVMPSGGIPEQPAAQDRGSSLVVQFSQLTPGAGAGTDVTHPFLTMDATGEQASESKAVSPPPAPAPAGLMSLSPPVGIGAETGSGGLEQHLQEAWVASSQPVAEAVEVNEPRSSGGLPSKPSGAGGSRVNFKPQQPEGALSGGSITDPGFARAHSHGQAGRGLHQQVSMVVPENSTLGHSYGGHMPASRRSSMDEDAQSQMSYFVAPQAPHASTASILVKYHDDIFEDSDEDENDFDDVVRHCTSECHALYHLRQVVKLVQHERSFLTCGMERMKIVEAKVSAPSATPSAVRRAATAAPKQEEPTSRV